MNKTEEKLSIAGTALLAFGLVLATGLGAYSRLINNDQLDFAHWVWAIRIMWGGVLFCLADATYLLAKTPNAFTLPHLNRRFIRVLVACAFLGALLTITFAVLPEIGVLPNFLPKPWPEPLASMAFGAVFVATPLYLLLLIYSGIYCGVVATKKHFWPSQVSQ